MANRLRLPSAAGTTNDFFRSYPGALLPDGTTDYTDNVDHNGSLGIKIGGAPTATFDHDGTETIRQTVLTNRATSTTLSAATTVDVSSSLVITQTTASITTTIPNPTTTTSGRMLRVGNNGTVPFNLAFTSPATGLPASIAVGPGTFLNCIWNGTAWQSSVAISANNDFWRTVAGAALPDGLNDPIDAIQHDGTVGLATGGTANEGVGIKTNGPVLGTLTVSAPTIWTPINILNQAANFGISTANVDTASLVVLFQSTAGITYTLALPTNLSAGRMLSVTHRGTVPITCTATNRGAGALPIVHQPNSTLNFVYNGVVWAADAASASSSGKISYGTAVPVAAGIQGETYYRTNGGTSAGAIFEEYRWDAINNLWVTPTREGVVAVAAGRAITAADYGRTLLVSANVTLTTPLIATISPTNYFTCRVRQSNVGVGARIAVTAGQTLVNPFGSTTGGIAGGARTLEITGTTVYWT